MRKLELESLKVQSFDTTAAAMTLRGTVAAYEDEATFSNCPDSYGGTCVMSVCLGCDSEATC